MGPDCAVPCTSAIGGAVGVPQTSPDLLQATQIMGPCAAARFAGSIGAAVRVEGLCQTKGFAEHVWVTLTWRYWAGAPPPPPHPSRPLHLLC